jgi:hypothetical protein
VASSISNVPMERPDHYHPGRHLFWEFEEHESKYGGRYYFHHGPRHRREFLRDRPSRSDRRSRLQQQSDGEECDWHWRQPECEWPIIRGAINLCVRNRLLKINFRLRWCVNWTHLSLCASAYFDCLGYRVKLPSGRTKSTVRVISMKALPWCIRTRSFPVLCTSTAQRRTSSECDGDKRAEYSCSNRCKAFCDVAYFISPQCRKTGFPNSEVNIKYSLCLRAVALFALLKAASICQQLQGGNQDCLIVF